jgi:hypothetical protein
MDWTIVFSVLVALLLWVLSLGLIAAVTLVTAFTVLRGRTERMAAGMMDVCKQHFETMMGGSETEKTNPFSFNAANGTAGPCQGTATGREARRDVAHG